MASLRVSTSALPESLGRSMSKVTNTKAPAFSTTTQPGAKSERKRAPGGGAKADDGVYDTKRKLVLLDPATVAVLSALGRGNLSLGIREAARRLVELGETAPFSDSKHLKRAGDGTG